MDGHHSGASPDSVPPCGHENPPSARFCDVCGVKLPGPCPHCHAINRTQANFCANCGIELRDARPPSATPFSVAVAPSPDSSDEQAAEAGPPGQRTEERGAELIDE